MPLVEGFIRSQASNGAPHDLLRDQQDRRKGRKGVSSEFLQKRKIMERHRTLGKYSHLMYLHRKERNC